jgi:ABC-type multidrug transport system fused ATPase/permease subunit
MIKIKFEHFNYFYRFLGVRIFISLLISLFIGILDALGLTMFLPLLQMVSNGDVDAEKMGNLGFLVELVESTGLSLSLQTALLIMLLFFTLKGVAKYFGEIYNVVLHQYFIRQIRFSTLHSLNNVSFTYFVTTDVGRIQNTLSGEVDRVAQAYHTYFKAFQNAVLLAVYMGFAFFVNWQFAILIAAGGWLTNLLYNSVYKHTVGTSKELTEHYHRFEGELIQHVSNYKYLKATGLIHKFGERLKSNILLIEEGILKMSKNGAILNAVREPMLIAVVAVVIIVHTQLLNGNLSHLLISLLFFYRALTSLTQLQTSWNQFLGVSGSLENMRSFQEELEKNEQKNNPQHTASFEQQLSLKNVRFSYGESLILDDINLNIQKNETVAIVGESGSGKTTLVNLISGLLLPQQGTITLDDRPYAELNLPALQKRIGYITQEPVIFNDTIYNNVTFWAPRTAENMERFQKAVKRASIDRFILEQGEAEETLLGNNGINLSGGQKQRISIARELYKDIDILIMDEATSSLDSETEQIIQSQIEELKGDYTILIIAHRLSTVRNADRVILLEKGRIQDKGTFKELVLKSEKFQRMVYAQEVSTEID